MFELLARCSWVLAKFMFLELCEVFGDRDEFLFTIISALLIMPCELE